MFCWNIIIHNIYIYRIFEGSKNVYKETQDRYTIFTSYIIVRKYQADRNPLHCHSDPQMLQLLLCDSWSIFTFINERCCYFFP